MFITCLRGYSKTGKSFEEFAQIMKENAQKDCDEFLSDVDTKGVEINPVYVLADSDDDYEHIITSANASKADLIVVGAKGRTNLSAFFVGSVTEKLIQLFRHSFIYFKEQRREIWLS